MSASYQYENHPVGLIMGLSPESSAVYYTELNRRGRMLLGGNNNPVFAMENVNFGEIEQLMNAGKWAEVADRIYQAAELLERRSVEAIAICSNTIHKIVNEVHFRSKLPVIHIGDAVANAMKDYPTQSKKVALLGTAYTMEDGFLIPHLQKYGAEVVVPPKTEFGRINDIIFQELCHGNVKEESSKYLFGVVEDLCEQQGISTYILGCTELDMVFSTEAVKKYRERCHINFHCPHDREAVFFDSTSIHIDAILDFCLTGKMP